MYLLNDKVAHELKKPFGKVYKELPSIEGKVVSIGDVTTKHLLSNGIIPNLSILDFKTKRNIPVDIPHKFKTIFEVENPQGCISDEAIERIKYLSTIHDRDMALIIKGEEDLLTIPVIKYFPEDTSVIYGQPDEGMVLLKITDELKQKIEKLLKEMEERWMDMDISIISDRNNPLLQRREIKFTVSFDAATPSIKDVKMKLVAVLNANKQVLVVDTLDQIFGKLEAEGYAKIYNDEKAMATIETKSVLEKNKIEEEAEAEVAEE